MSTSMFSGKEVLDRTTIEEIVRKTVYDFLPDTQLGRSAQVDLPKIPRLVVNISARHIHLNRSAMDVLFGQGSVLTVQKMLYQDEAFAAQETLSVLGPRKQLIANVRVLGPLREYNQVELAFTDARFLGIEAPVRLSGNVENTPGCFLVGPNGGLELDHGVLRAARHVHMNSAEAEYYGVRAGDHMRLVVDSDQGGLLEGLICRISDKEKLEVHIDTDEGNALDLVQARKVYIEK
ncbi:MAG: phosphate propanoyltransferase [Candidatus Latescibacterota bacterium]|nr:phosphate propanoyltransferase [Candidatus Latescibacterota bacterium]